MLLENAEFKIYNQIELDEEFKTQCQTFDELRLYFIIDGLGGFIWKTNHDIGHDRIKLTPELQLEILTSRKKVEYAVKQTSRFGVDDLEERETGQVIPSDKYWKWFRWWDAWKTNLTDEEWNEVDSISTELDSDLSKYRPEGDWK